MAETLPGALAGEIGRVSALRERYRSYQLDPILMDRALPPASLAPAIALMTLALDAAVKAAASPDIEGQIRALNDLQGFTDG